MGINTLRTFKDGFLQQGGTVLCGEIQGLPEFAGRVEQAFNMLADKTLLQGMPISISNKVLGTDTTQLLNAYNPRSLNIVALGTSAADTDGFCVWGDTDIGDIDGSVGYPRSGVLTRVALIGSGLRVFLPADASLSGVFLKSPVYYDNATGMLKLSTNATTNPPLPIKIVGSLVDGKKVMKNATTNVIEWVATKAILVQL